MSAVERALDGPVAVVVAAMAASTAVALGGWILHAASSRRGEVTDQTRPPPCFKRGAAMVVASVAIVSTPIGPVVAVFSILVALNQLLGRAEHVPFSTYPMFSRPDRRSWSIRLEGGSGELVSTTSFGMIPAVVRKRFASELEAARAASGDVLQARFLAATALGQILERRRPRIGALATETVDIVLVEYEFDGRALRCTRTTLAACAPP